MTVILTDLYTIVQFPHIWTVWTSAGVITADRLHSVWALPPSSLPVSGGPCFRISGIIWPGQQWTKAMPGGEKKKI